MPLPRHLAARNRKNTKSNRESRLHTNNLNKYADILRDNKIGHVHYSECRYVDIEGKSHNFNCVHSESNMRIGVNIITSDEITPEEKTYDLFDVERTKIVRDLRSKMQDDTEIDYEKLADDIVNRNCQNDCSTNIHRKANLFHKQMAKYFRLEQINGVRYVEFKYNSAYMTINPVKLYRIDMKTSDDKVLYLILGDMQMKSDQAKLLDPTYDMEEAVKDQFELLEKTEKMNEAQEPHDLDNSDRQPHTCVFVSD